MDIVDLPTVKKMKLDELTKQYLSNKDVISEIENMKRLLNESKIEMFEKEKASFLKDADDNGLLSFVIEDVLNKIGVRVKAKRGRKPKVAPEPEIINEDIYGDFTKPKKVVRKPQVAPEIPMAQPVQEAPKRKRPQVAPVKRKRPQVAPEIPMAQPVQEAPKRKRPQVAPEASKRKRPQVAPQVVVGKSKEVKGRRKVATKEDIAKISKNVVKAIEGTTIGNAVYEAKRKGEVVDVKRVLEEVYTNKGSTGYSLVDATNFLKGGMARKRNEDKE